MMAITTKAEGGPITGGGLGGCHHRSISGQYPATGPVERQLTNAEVFDLTGAAGQYRTVDLSLTKIEVQPQTLDFARVRDPKTAEHTANSPLFPANFRPRNQPPPCDGSPTSFEPSLPPWTRWRVLAVRVVAFASCLAFWWLLALAL